MARPRIYHEPRVVTAVRLPISLRTRLDSTAAARNESLTVLVTRAVTDLLDAETIANDSSPTVDTPSHPGPTP